MSYRAPFIPFCYQHRARLSSPAFPKRRERGRKGAPGGGGGTWEQPGPPVVMARPSVFPSYVRLMGLCPARLRVHLSPRCSAPRRPPRPRPGRQRRRRPPPGRAAEPRPSDSLPAYQTPRGGGRRLRIPIDGSAVLERL